MKKPGSFAVLFALTIALLAPAALAQSTATDSGAAQAKHAGRGEHRHGQQRGRMGRFQFGRLNLTDAQKVSLKQIRENHKAAVSGLHQQLGMKRKELREAMRGGEFNEALASQKLAEMAPMQAKLMAERMAMRHESLNVLTAEQKTQLQQQRMEWKAKRAAHYHSEG